MEDFPENLLNEIEEILKEELKTVAIVDAFQIPKLSPSSSSSSSPSPSSSSPSSTSSDHPMVAIWKGDITTLKIDGIVNAANRFLLGCFTPNHPCIDNAIHCRSGPRLRMKCHEIMKQQASLEPTGKAKITPGYCLPSAYVLHTVGPIIEPGQPERPDELASCYIECLNLAKENQLRSIAFCCISTGVYGYPQEAAANVALKTVKTWLQENKQSMDLVVFNVFLDKDLQIYSKLAPTFFS